MSQTCPICGASFADGPSHCPECGTRGSALPKRAAEHRPDEPLLRRSIVRGVVLLVVLLAISAAIAPLVGRSGRGYASQLGDATGIVGGLTLAAAIVLTGMGAVGRRRTPEVIRARFRGERQPLAPVETRLLLAITGVVVVITSLLTGWRAG